MMFIDDHTGELADTSWFPSFEEMWTTPFYKIPYLPWDKSKKALNSKLKNDLRHCLGTRLIITEKMEGLLFKASRESWELLDNPLNANQRAATVVRLREWWDKFHKNIPPTLEIFGTASVYSDRIWYSKLLHFLTIHTIYDMTDQKIYGYHSTLNFCSKEIQLPVAPLLLSGEFRTTEELKDITTDIVNSKSLFSSEDVSGIIIRREEPFMCFSGDTFMAQMNNPDKGSGEWNTVWGSGIQNRIAIDSKYII